MDGTESSSATKTKRRNGQLMSCEPCRRSKQRCDHGLPHCLRCRKRGPAAEAKCHYHPAPMTRGARHATPQAHGGSSQSSDPSRTSVQNSTFPSPLSINNHEPVIDRGTSLVGMDNVLPPLLKLPANDSVSTRTYTAITRTGIASPVFTVTPTLSAEGVKLLETVRDAPPALSRAVQHHMIEHPESACQGILVKIACGAVEDVLLPDISTDDSPASMSRLCKNLFKSTSQPLQWPVSPANGALQQAFSTNGIRWDTLGIYYALSGVILAEVREGLDSIDFLVEKWGPTRKCAMERSLDACIQCYSICERMGQVNDLTICLLTTAIMLATWCYGDDSYQAWRLMGDLTSVIGALGFQNSTQDDIPVPPYLQELRRRAMTSAHELDKGFATFVGRPPRLSRHYIGVGLPLDLPDVAILDTPENLAIATAALDSNGWNTEGRVYAATRLRVIAILLEIREEALELSLGPRTSDLDSRCRGLLEKSAATWASLPPHEKYDSSMWATLPNPNMMILLYFRLQMLYTEFILQKLMVNRDPSSRSMLIKTSHLILSLVLSALSRRIVLSGYRIDLEWTMVNYAMPCASVLILELLRHKEQPQHPFAISRPRLIQDLSVLISCCDWLTEPDQQNYALCKRAQSIFSRSLDRILSTEDEPPNHHFDHNSAAQGPTVQENQTMLIDEPEWMAWLETCNLQADPWLDILADTTQSYPSDSQSGMQNDSGVV